MNIKEAKELLEGAEKICSRYICPLSGKQCAGNRCPGLQIEPVKVRSTLVPEGAVIFRCTVLGGNRGVKLGYILDENENEEGIERAAGSE